MIIFSLLFPGPLCKKSRHSLDIFHGNSPMTITLMLWGPCRTATPLQQVDLLCLCKYGDHEYMIPFESLQSSYVRMRYYA